jgi:Txe/YoeB family toxin of Txe-Axe toxin-antitoxin module
MKNILFSGKAYEEFVDWAETDFDNFEKMNRLIKDISRSPFKTRTVKTSIERLLVSPNYR